ncbi:hypothetical protein SAMN02746066_04371 [Anaerosporobacter mobilis DSM 15930]|jgi:hypothetical protein|uniref:Uncharacterized protein n=1 Tax=Anaerosporobacter mobilis DSM 15930 TaxID=1120996 RepID=A0A1M7NCM2_9FIRM|nr:hypothetical protein SAMN02746066_04371 [Anaerosporobacter mobilis DSM 15930]
MVKPMRTAKVINRTSIVITILMFILAYGTIGALEQGNINMLQATRRLLIFILLILFNSSVAYLTGKEDKH